MQRTKGVPYGEIGEQTGELHHEEEERQKVYALLKSRSREHQNPAPPVVVNAEHVPEPLRNRNDYDSSSPQSENVQSNSQSRQGSKTSSTQAVHEETSEESSQLKKLSLAQLKDRCKERDEKISGKKDDLIQRLLKPRKPEILIMRTR